MSRSVFIFGESGRMGQEVRKIVDQSEHLNYVGGYSQQNTNLEPTAKPDIVIDFSLPETLSTLSDFVNKHSSALVSGTTGYTKDEFEKFKSMGGNQPVFWSANMSFGVYLMCQLTEMLARYEKFYSFKIEETHHIHKKDKPSGTALIIEKAARKSTEKLQEIESLREGEVFGLHRFIASSKNETLEIVHEAHNRSLWAQGALDISQWLVGQKPGFYGMDDFFQNLKG